MDYAIISDGRYIFGLLKGSGYQIGINEPEYRMLLSLLQSRPTAPEGYAYLLRATDLEWVLVEYTPDHPEPEEIDFEEALEILLGVSK